MVLESIIHPLGVKGEPKNAFVLGIVYAAIAIVLAFFIFPDDPSISIIFLTTLAALPLLIDILMQEQKESMAHLKKNRKMPLMGTHLDVFMVFGYMFLGFLVCFLAVYIFLPENVVAVFFSKQIQTIRSIVGPVGFATGMYTGAAMGTEESLRIIMLNNFKVLLFTLLFSFLYGAGAIFIIAWNSSILAVAMGNIIKTRIAALGELTGFGAIAAYFQAGSISVLRYMIHGLPEIGAYLLGAISGGIISAAVIRSDYKDSRFYEIILDSFDIIALAALLLIVAALLEVGVTPLIIR